MIFEEFNTISIENKGILNCQPLIYLEEDDLHESLTPVLLYCGNRILHATEDENYNTNASCVGNHDQAVSTNRY